MIFGMKRLRELDEMRFTIVETSEEILARHRPVVLITSNHEKELPDAFLRRCIFYCIEFPDPALMRRIVAVHHPHLDAKLLDQKGGKYPARWAGLGPRYNQ